MVTEEQLIDGLQDAHEGMREMIGYVPDYFRKKWRLDEYIENTANLLTRCGYEPGLTPE